MSLLPFDSFRLCSASVHWPVVDVVVLSSPAPVFVGEAVDLQKLFFTEARDSSKVSRIGQPAAAKRERGQHNTAFAQIIVKYTAFCCFIFYACLKSCLLHNGNTVTYGISETLLCSGNSWKQLCCRSDLHLKQNYNWILTTSRYASLVYNCCSFSLRNIRTWFVKRKWTHIEVQTIIENLFSANKKKNTKFCYVPLHCTCLQIVSYERQLDSTDVSGGFNPSWN